MKTVENIKELENLIEEDPFLSDHKFNEFIHFKIRAEKEFKCRTEGPNQDKFYKSNNLEVGECHIDEKGVEKFYVKELEKEVTVRYYNAYIYKNNFPEGNFSGYVIED